MPVDKYNDFDNFEGGWSYLHEAAKQGNFDIVHYLLSETDIDPNMIGRGTIQESPEETKEEQNGKPFYFAFISCFCVDQWWTPLQIAAYFGYYKIVAILLAEPRTIPDFTAGSDQDTPMKIAKRKSERPGQVDNTLGSGVSFTKWAELIQDNEDMRKTPKLRARETLKKFDRCHSALNPLTYFTPKKANSCFQKLADGNILRSATESKPIDLDKISNENAENLDSIEMILKRVLKPYKLSYVPLDFLEGQFYYYNFIGEVGKQSKVIKKVMERKIKLDVLEGKLIEYKEVFDYPSKPNRVSSVYLVFL